MNNNSNNNNNNNNGNQNPQQQQQQGAYHGYQSYDQYMQAYQYYQQYQYNVTASTSQMVGSALPPSYSSPLSGANTNSPFQSQYNKSMMAGAAAASAAVAALSGSTTATASEPAVPWYSSYQAPTPQQRAALLLPPSYGTVPSSLNNRSGQPYQGKGPRNANNNRTPNNSANKSNKGKMNTKPAETEVGSTVKIETGDKDMGRDGFHCDACDVTFHQERTFKTHVAAHRKCPECQYSASPSLVNEHRKLTHLQQGAGSTAAGETSTPPQHEPAGSKSKQPPTSNISKLSKPVKEQLFEKPHPLTPTLNTPEDIEKWIAQRRKAWPTAANVQKKEEERKEMAARGQLPNDKKKNNNKNDRKNKNNNRHNNKREQQHVQNGDEESVAKKPKIESPVAMATAVVATTSTSTAPNAIHESIASIAEAAARIVGQTNDMEVDSISNSTVPLVPHALTSEESDQDEDMDPVHDAITSKDPSAIGKVLLPDEKPRQKRHCTYYARGRCTKGDECGFIHDPSMILPANQIKNKNKGGQHQGPVKVEVFRTRPSLLQMLLSSEITKEKNMLLEAMRYMVECQFFDSPEPTDGPLVSAVVE